MPKHTNSKKKKRLSFYPQDKEGFIAAEATLRGYIDKGDSAPPQFLSQFLNLLYSKQEEDVEFTEAYNELINAYLTAIRVEVTMFFKNHKVYSFKADDGAGKEYSLDNWLTIFFDELKRMDINVKEERNRFINHTVNSLRSYISGLNTPPITLSGIFVVTGYICVMFGGFVHPKAYNPSKYKYYNYIAYLRSSVKGYVKE